MFCQLTHRLLYLAALAITLGFEVGCSSGDFAVQPAQGKVLCQGEPVTGGSITFIPIGDENAQKTGKVATAAIKPDGTFVLSTYGRFDGAIVGKHRVEYIVAGGDSASEDEEKEVTEDTDSESASPTPKRNNSSKESKECVQDREIIVEVTYSKNDFTIDL